MATVSYRENPRTTDTIEFELAMPGADGCLTSDPYKVNIVKIFYVEKNFAAGNLREIEISTPNEALEDLAIDAEETACEDPTEENQTAATKARGESDAASVVSPVYYSSAIPVAIFGSETFPAWLSTDTGNASIEHITEDDDGNTVYGRFKVTWYPKGSVRAGNYFVCWMWTPQSAGDSLLRNEHFTINSDTNSTASIPTHATAEGKYATLLDRYTPGVYKSVLCEDDLTRGVIDKLNQVIADSFTQIEDMANEVIDLYNANIVHESVLVLLSNSLGRKLRSEDPTLWRRQISNAVQLYKKKGTLPGLEQALDEAGITLNKVTKLWQVISPYTYQEAFIVADVDEFVLSHVAVLPVDENYELFVRISGTSDYVSFPIDYVEFSTDDGVTTMSWTGDTKSTSPVALDTGDEILIKYVIIAVPDSTQQTIETFIADLPLADQRDSQTQEYPLKNWNVRLIEEDSPMFDILIPTKHPFHDPVIFGWVRTEFPFSENIFNMEEYNGSSRESTNPCDIDKTFLDPCGACLSSSVNIDIEIEEISDLRISEAREVIEEFSPFHMNVAQLNISGQIEEIIPSPVEEIEALITINHEDIVLCGNANGFFTRVRDEGNTNNIISREDLATGTIVVSGLTGTAYNNLIVLYDFFHNFKDLGINLNDHVFEVLAPSANSGTYTIVEINKNTLVVSGVTEPLNASSFSYNIFNRIYTTVGASVVQDDRFVFDDENFDFTALGVQTLQEDASWKVLIPAYTSTPFLIMDVLPDGSLILENNGALPTSNDNAIEYTLYTDSDIEVLEGSNGTLTVTRRGLVDVNDPLLTTPIGDVQTILKFGDLMEISGTQYEISEFVDDQTFYINDYAGGNAGGLNVPLYRQLVNVGTGFFDYQGIKLQTAGDHEAELGIMNGANAPTDDDDITESDDFKENYLVIINDTDYYKIAEWDGDTITLDGPKEDWTTYTAGGTSVDYALKHFVKSEIYVDANTNLLEPDEHRFAFIDRRGNDMIQALLPNETTSFIALANTPGANIEEAIHQEESISFIIEYRDGRIEEGTI